jgi:hypothetical protein
MSKIDVPPEHDQEARARIRNKLLHYMREHRIGAPELTARIYAAQEPQQKKSVGISTVQRFLANKVRTVESYVDMFERFAKDFPSPDPIGALGERLSVFFGAGNGRDYSGRYLANAGVVATLDGETANDTEIVIAPDAGFWRVTEKTAPGLNHAIYDGVLACSGHAAVVVLKDRLEGRARNYMLWPENETLRGQGEVVQFLGIQKIEIRLTKI